MSSLSRARGDIISEARKGVKHGDDRVVDGRKLVLTEVQRRVTAASECAAFPCPRRVSYTCSYGVYVKSHRRDRPKVT